VEGGVAGGEAGSNVVAGGGEGAVEEAGEGEVRIGHVFTL